MEESLIESLEINDPAISVFTIEQMVMNGPNYPTEVTRVRLINNKNRKLQITWYITEKEHSENGWNTPIIQGKCIVFFVVI